MLHLSEPKNGLQREKEGARGDGGRRLSYLRVGLGGVEGPPTPSSSSSLSETEEANVTAHSGSSPCTHYHHLPPLTHLTPDHTHLEVHQLIFCSVCLGALDA